MLGLRSFLGSLLGVPGPAPGPKRWKRYDMLQAVFARDAKRKRNILEIGTYNGYRAISFIDIARAYFNAKIPDEHPIYVDLPPEDPG